MAIPYNRNWKLPKGTYLFKIFFYEKDGDPKSTKDLLSLLTSRGTSLTRNEFIQQVVLNTIGKFNALNLGVVFEFDSVEITPNDTYHGGVHYVANVESTGNPSSANGLEIRMGLKSGAPMKGYKGTLYHEMLHNLGFGHKDKLIQEEYHQGYHLFASKYTPSDDDIMGLDVKYQNPNVSKIISGNIVKRELFDEAIIYLVNHDGELCYQSPVWSDGYYEFRLRNKKEHTLLVLGQNESGDFYSIDKGLTWKPFHIKDRIDGVSKPIVFIHKNVQNEG